MPANVHTCMQCAGPFVWTNCAFPLRDGPLVFTELCLSCDKTNTSISAATVGEETVDLHYAVKDVKGKTV